jgi:hypothetical protein
MAMRMSTDCVDFHSMLPYGASAIDRDYFQFPRYRAKRDPQNNHHTITNGKRGLCGIMP